MRLHFIAAGLLVAGLLALLWLSASGSLVAAKQNCSEEIVCDKAGIFTAPQLQNLAQYHAALLDRYDMDYRIVVSRDTSDLSARAVSVFQEQRIGSRSKNRKGILLLVDPLQNMVRLEISAGLDAVYTDGFVAYLQQRQMIPFFKSSRVADGILATTEMIVTRSQQAQSGQEFIEPENLPQVLSIGAGAQTNAQLGASYTPAAPSVQKNTKPEGFTPEQVVAAYHSSLARKDASADLAIYSRATRAMKTEWVVTAAQMRNELSAYKKCDRDKTVYIGHNTRAVVRYRIEQRKCAPYFLIMEDGGWRLDFVTTMETIRFNLDNDWHFAMDKKSYYAAAFSDWRLNRNGYPFPQPKMRWGLSIQTDYQAHVTWVSKVHADTPADSMGLREMDVILKWDTLDAPDHKQIMQSMSALDAGKKVQVQVERSGQKLGFELTVPPKI